jgi:deoxyribodipyrimidine photo-lyase
MFDAATREAGLARLAAFVPRAGRRYAVDRNTDRGAGAEPTTAQLSPYLRRRLILEEEAIGAARACHADGADRFVEELLWRGYWKGFLEQHPDIWPRYRAEATRGWNRLATEAGLRRVFEDATAGRTGIDCFDAWARELVSRNWLHNHARMWFASIWIFTLRLPWALGADFFARHLLDGDPASNTLSWRWVAGLHTPGKAYVARAGNIARYTEGRFDPAGALDEDPEPLTEADRAPALALPDADPLPSGEVAVLLHDDDLCAELLELPGMRVRAVAGFSAVDGMAHAGVAEPVRAFSAAALGDGLRRAGAAFGAAPTELSAADVPAWAACVAMPVVAAYAPIGPAADVLARIAVARVSRPYDRAVWARAGRGFFQLRAQIPRILAELERCAP